MRLSPLLAATIAAVASVSLSKPSSGQTTEFTTETPEANGKLSIDELGWEKTFPSLPSPTGVPATAPSPQFSVQVPEAPESNLQIDAGTQEHGDANTPKFSSYVVNESSWESDLIPEQIIVQPDESPVLAQETPNGESELEEEESLSDGENQPSEPSEPTTPAPPPITPTQTPPEAAEPRVLVAEVLVNGAPPELESEIYRVIETQPGRPTTRSQLQEDVNAVFATGFFSNVDVEPIDTPLGVRITFLVTPNPVLREVAVDTLPTEGERILPQEVVDEIFTEQYGKIINLRDLQQGIIELNEWYKEQGYDLAQVVNAEQVQINDDGTVKLIVAEGVIQDILVRYLDEEGEPVVDEEGNELPPQSDKEEPIGGRTRPFIITREIQLKPGDVFNRAMVQRDLQRVFGLGIFDDVRLSFAPGDDPSKVLMVVDVIEKKSGSFAAGGGFSSANGFFGSASYQQQNLGGNNQILGAEFQLGTRALLFDLSFTDPWIAGDPYRTSYTANIFRRRSISLVYGVNDDNDIRVFEDDGVNTDRPRIVRTGGGIRFSRPIADNPYVRPDWRLSLGTQFQTIAIRNGDGDITPRSTTGEQLSFSDDGTDDLITLQLGAVRDRRNNLLRPTQGSLLRLSTEQSVPVGGGSILMNRIRANYNYYIPVELTNFVQEEEGNKSQTIALNIQGGTILGDLPPYEAFSLGGSESIRGYESGEVGSGRTYIQGTVEYRFPIFNFLGAVLFVDAGTTLGTDDEVPGDPSVVRGLPGEGIGYGVGARIQSPLGPIRIDFGWNDEGDNQFHFGIGERF
ncbi:MAG: BamA/TamA family outer membrane protein [Symploca sp. SIO2D2]|nr:BamA/TamA family outer membrane protein [Symploca sp. SIO2D2]